MSTRREFVQTLLASGALATGLACAGGGSSKQATSPTGPQDPPTPAPTAPILISLKLDGGNDLLNTLVPIGGPNLTIYQQKRPHLAVPAANTLDVGASLGLNRALGPLLDLAQAGRLALIPGIGMPGASLSHFTASDLWDMGAVSPDGSGWLGRYADLAFTPGGDPLRAITTDQLTTAHIGRNRSFAVIGSRDGYRYPSTQSDWGTVDNPEPLRLGFTDGFQLTPAGGTGLNAALASGRLYDQAQTSFAQLLGPTVRTPSVPYPGDANHPDPTLRDGWFPLAYQLKFVAEMIAKGVPCQAFAVGFGGFDTHGNQAQDHPRLLKELGTSLAAFYADLASISTPQGPAQERVLLMGWSEFGRRVEQNQGGTDHGTAGLAFCLGRGVKGGLYASYPNLADLDENGDMKQTLDFRSLYATVLDKWLKVDSRTILGGAYPPLGFI